MRVLVQRCENASVTANGKLTGTCQNGLMLLVGFTKSDTEEHIAYMTRKVLNFS